MLELMNNSNDYVRVFIDIEDDIEQIEHATRQLRQEIDGLGIGPVEIFLKEPQIPDGAKSIDPTTLHALILSVTPVTVAKVLEFIYSWMMRKAGRSVKIKIQRPKGGTVEVEIPASMSQEELNHLIKTVEDSISKRSKKRK